MDCSVSVAVGSARMRFCEPLLARKECVRTMPPLVAANAYLCTRFGAEINSSSVEARYARPYAWPSACASSGLLPHRSLPGRVAAAGRRTPGGQAGDINETRDALARSGPHWSIAAAVSCGAGRRACTVNLWTFHRSAYLSTRTRVLDTTHRLRRRRGSLSFSLSHSDRTKGSYAHGRKR